MTTPELVDRDRLWQLYVAIVGGLTAACIQPVDVSPLTGKPEGYGLNGHLLQAMALPTAELMLKAFDLKYPRFGVLP
jgi:hypothetical protein